MRDNRSRVCSWCGAAYVAFVCGLRFAEVRRELAAESRSRDPERRSPRRRYVTRHTVLGRMHEHKLNFWHEYHGPGRCEIEPIGPAGHASDLAQLPELPF